MDYQDYQAEVVVANELDSWERLLWSGRPGQGILFRGFDDLCEVSH